MEKNIKKAFENVEIEIVKLANVDVITTSDDDEIVLPPDPFSIF